jgi:hypothetical protein
MATMLRKEMVDNLSRIVVRGQRWLTFSSAMRDLEIALIQTKEDLLQLKLPKASFFPLS